MVKDRFFSAIYLYGSERVSDQVAVVRSFRHIIIALDSLPAEGPVSQVLVDDFPCVIQDRSNKSGGVISIRIFDRILINIRELSTCGALRKYNV